jgi:exonuclease III
MIPLQPPLDAHQRLAGKTAKRQIEQRMQLQDHFGDKLRKKGNSTMRILMCNPNGLTGIGRSHKMERIKNKSLSYQLDALCIVEHGQNLRRTPVQEQLKHNTQGWWNHRRISQTYNRHFDTGKKSQVGGVSIILADTLAHRSSKSNHDPTGLGRWTSILVKGKQHFATRIICAYRPCKSSGPETAYVQQALYFNRIQRKGDPRKIFMEDLAAEILKWKQQGERIIVVGDFNMGDKTSISTQSQFWSPWLTRTGLVDVHKTIANTNNVPSTHERGKVQIQNKTCWFLTILKIPR